MRTNKKVLVTAVGIALAALGTAAFAAGTFQDPVNGSSPKEILATENFGPAAITSADWILMPPGFTLTYTTGAGASGGYAVNAGGSLYIYFRLQGGAALQHPAFLVDFSLSAWPGGAWTVNNVSTSTDLKTVLIHVINTTGATQIVGTGAHVHWIVGSSLGNPAEQIVPTSAYGTAGDQLSVVASVSALIENANVGALPADVDSAPAYTFIATADAINGAVTANPTPRKIAVDAASQRKLFVGPSAYNNLGRLSWSNIGGTQWLHDGTVDYTITAPAGRLMSATVTAGSGSFNAGTLFLSNDPDCSAGGFAAFTLNAAKTVASISGVSAAAAAADPWVCYQVGGAVQINEVTGITAASTLAGPAGINDIDRSITGSLASIVNDGTVIDTRIYIPVAVNQFGYGMSLRIINTGATAADVFAQYIYNDGTLGTQGKIATGVAVGGYVMLENIAIEAAIGAPDAAKGPNPRVRIVAPTSSLRVQTFLRTNGVWAEVSGGQGEMNPYYGGDLPTATNQ